MKSITIICFLFFTFKIYGQSGLTVVAVGDATLVKEKVYFELLEIDSGISPNQRKTFDELIDLFQNDFSFYQKKFMLIETKKIVKSNGKALYDLWKSKDYSYYITSKITYENKNMFINVIAYNVKDRIELGSIKKLLIPGKIRLVGHTITDQIYKKITGKRSIFLSKIAFVSDRNGTRRKPVKELYMMDFDGRNTRRLTYHRGTVISPAFSNDGIYISYSLIPNTRQKHRNIDLHVLNLTTMKNQKISFRKGINSGAIFMPGNRELALTLSYVGNAEIFMLDRITKKIRRITHHYGHDVDPSISYDGSIMAFLSSRPGKAMIYTLDPTGTEKNVKRISYVGDFNATPRFSPDGREIVFSSWLDNRFDIFRINPDGSGLTRLTKNFGSNEDPTYSSDSEFIAFSSQRVLSLRKAIQDIYIMDREGEILGAVTSNFGNCVSPRWSHF